MSTTNIWLAFGGGLSFLAAALHIAVIFGGPDWYRFVGAGEKMAQMAERGDIAATLITLGIASILTIWGLYALSGAGLIMRLPLLPYALLAITSVYLLRGLVLLPMYFLKPDMISAFWVWSSAICLGYGITHAVGLWRGWSSL